MGDRVAHVPDLSMAALSNRQLEHRSLAVANRAQEPDVRRQRRVDAAETPVGVRAPDVHDVAIARDRIRKRIQKEGLEPKGPRRAFAL